MVGGLSWGYVGPHLGAMLAHLGAMLAHLGGVMLAHLEAMLADLKAYVGPCWPISSHKLRKMGKNGNSKKHCKTREFLAGGVVGGRVSFGEERTAVRTTWARRAPGRIYAGRPCRRPTPEPARPLIYGVSCVRAWGHKNIGFLRCFARLDEHNFCVGEMEKKRCFYVVLVPRKGPGREKRHLGGLSTEMVSHIANLAST